MPLIRSYLSSSSGSLGYGPVADQLCYAMYGYLWSISVEYVLYVVHAALYLSISIYLYI